MPPDGEEVVTGISCRSHQNGLRVFCADGAVVFLETDTAEVRYVFGTDNTGQPRRVCVAVRQVG